MGGKSSKSKSSSSSSSSPPLSTQDQSILELKRQKDRLSKYKVKLESILQLEKETAKKLLKEGKTEKAKLALRKKKYQETQIDKVEVQIGNLESLVNSIEYASISTKVAKALQEGNVALQKLNNELNIEDVENLMEDTAEAIEYQNKISELLGANLNQQDEEDVMKTLDDMQREVEGKEKEKDGDIHAQIQSLPEAKVREAEKNLNVSNEQKASKKVVEMST